MADRIAPLVVRSRWRARRAKEITLIEARAVRFLVVHYTGMDADEQRDHRNCAGRVRGIQRYHMESDQLAKGGASDLAYNWLVCRHGYAFQGRGWKRRPAATGQANDFTLAACFLGDDTRNRADVTPEARRAFRSILEFLLPPRCPNLAGVRGHRDFMATTCPGDELAAFVRRLDREYFGRGGRAGGPVSSANVT
jgi:N-acetylmuramoyl-L-alanine amidase